MISNKENKKKMSGFTIVELLIVIVVIGILAAITIVAYNGIQKKANTTSAQNAANSVMKKIEASNAVKSGYPADAGVVGYLATLNSDETSKIGTDFAITQAVPNAGNGKTTVQVQICKNPATTGPVVGAKVFYFDYSANSVTAVPYTAGDTSLTAGCVALGA